LTLFPKKDVFMIEYSLAFILITLSVAFLIGLAKGGVGGALGSLATPLMALVVPTKVAIGLVLPILLVGDAFSLAAYWRQWSWRTALLLIPGSLLGVTLATVFITNVPAEVLRIGLGIIVLLFTLYKILENRILAAIQYRPQKWHGVAAGGFSGFLSTIAHSGAPPVSIYLLYQDFSPQKFIATSVLFFAVLNLIKVPYYIEANLIDLQSVWRVAWSFLAVPLGVWAGKWFGNHVSKQTFEKVIVALLAIAAVLLLFT
jgi:uncharacterized membrane protein YfcA